MRENENKVVELLIRDGMQKWSEIWTKIDWRDDKRFIRNCLIKLQNDNKILKIKTDKKIRYAWAGDIEILESLRKEIKQRDDFFPKVREQISQTKGDENINRVTDFYTTFMLAELSNYLKSLHVWVDVDKKWKGTAQFLVLRYNVECFANLLNDCKKVNLQAFEKSVGAVCATLDNLSSEFWKRLPPVEKDDSPVK